MTGTTLVNLRQMFRAECGLETDETIATADNTRINLLLANTQKWLAAQFPLLLKVVVEVQLTPAGQYYSFPSSTLDRQFLRGDQTVLYGTTRFGITYGINQEDYEYLDGDSSDPVERWQLINVGVIQFIEVWPIPASAQTLILTGQRPLQSFTSDSHTCDIDDLLIVLFTAAKWQAKEKSPDASALLSQAREHLHHLLGSQPSQFETFILGGGCPERRSGNRGTVAATIATDATTWRCVLIDTVTGQPWALTVADGQMTLTETTATGVPALLITSGGNLVQLSIANGNITMT